MWLKLYSTMPLPVLTEGKLEVSRYPSFLQKSLSPFTVDQLLKRTLSWLTVHPEASSLQLKSCLAQLGH